MDKCGVSVIQDHNWAPCSK